MARALPKSGVAPRSGATRGGVALLAGADRRPRVTGMRQDRRRSSSPGLPVQGSRRARVASAALAAVAFGAVLAAFYVPVSLGRLDPALFVVAVAALCGVAVGVLADRAGRGRRPTVRS